MNMEDVKDVKDEENKTDIDKCKTIEDNEEDIIQFDKIDERINNLTLKDMNNDNIQSFVHQYREDALVEVEDEIGRAMKNIGMEEQFHIYFLDMIKYHIYKDHDDKHVIREYPIVLDHLDSNDKINDDKPIHHNSNQKSFRLFNWNTGAFQEKHDDV